MLSSILSRIFGFLFLLSILGGILNFIVQVKGTPISFALGGNGKYNIGQPGIEVKAKRSVNLEHKAPDTTVSFSIIDSDGKIKSKGEINLNYFSSGELMNRITAVKQESDSVYIDTTITIIGQLNRDKINTEFFSEFAVNQDSTVLYSRMDLKGKKIRPSLTFPDLKSAKKYAFWEDYYSPNDVFDLENTTSTLRIMPDGRFQYFMFIIYELTRLVCLSFFLLYLSVLFYNFSKKEFFSSANIRLVKRTGWLFIIPSLASAVLYFTFLKDLSISKIELTAESNMKVICSYNIETGIDPVMITIGISLLVLGIIFKNGLNMKEDISTIL